MENTIECSVVGIKDYGVFCSCDEYNGLLHISEISNQYVDDIFSIFEIGDMLNLYILEKDEKYKKLKLSYKLSHPIHERIRKHVTIKKGFNSLKRQLNTWIKETK